MPRLLFEKTGNAVWISHLDLMRLFQRAFKRANLPLKHTQGFNPRPSVSIALPLSVGTESVCELLDFDLDGVSIPDDIIKERLNLALVPGIRVLDAYDNGRKLRDLALLKCEIMYEYDDGIPDGALSAIQELFSRSALIVPKKTKNGIQDQDIISMIHGFEINARNNNTICMDVVICCQNPTLNPVQFSAAIEMYLPEYIPDFTRYRRTEIFDNLRTVFR